MTTPGTALKFRKKPVTIEAMQYHGLSDMENRGEVLAWLEEHGVDWRQAGDLKIITLEGEMLVRPGWWVIRGVQGEFYPCAPDIFEATYDQADGPTYDELMEILAGVVDCAIWLTGVSEMPEDSAWPEMREKLNRALPVVRSALPEEEPVA